MSNLKEFIEVTSIYDGKKAMIRAALIDSVIDNDREVKNFYNEDGATFSFVTKPSCRRIFFNGNDFEASESYEDIINMIYNAEL